MPSDCLKVLNKIEQMIIPLNPPVFQFEDGIRDTSFKILISVMLSARTKDTVTLPATRRLFARAETPREMITLSEDKIAALIYPVGFYKQKAKNVKKIARRILDLQKIPDQLPDLTALPGVGRKTANLVLSLAFNIPSIAVDTHVLRISGRLGWTKSKDPDSVEKNLKNIFTENTWNRLNKLLVGFGQTICRPISPRCNQCIITDFCDYFLSKIN